MLRRLTAALVALALLASAALTLRSAWEIWSNPALRAIRDATVTEITAALDRDLARVATPDRLAKHIESRLAEDPRNWVALDALVELAESRNITLLPALHEAVAAARAQDHSPARLAQECAACVLDIGACTIGTGLVCKAPILLTPLEDLRGLGQAGYDYVSGTEVDQIDLGLSVIGLTATSLAIATGGSSLTLKAGTGLAKLARGLRLVSPRLTQDMAAAVRSGIDWMALPAVRSTDDLTRLIRADALVPLTRTLGDLGTTAERLGPAATLHLLPMIDNAAEAGRLARVADAVGPRTVVAAELMGKTRLFRTTLRISRIAAELAIGFFAFAASLGSALTSLITGHMLRRTHHRLRPSS